MSHPSRIALRALAVFIVTFAFGIQAHAQAAPSVSIQLISGSTAVSAGYNVSFAASASGFISPTYAIADSFSGSGSTVGTIDSSGYFTWTPTVYDSGWHTITVTATDTYNHTASATISIDVVSNAAFVSAVAPGPIVQVGHTVGFTISTPGYVSPSYVISDSYPGSNVTAANIDSNGNFLWTPQLGQQGQHNFTIYVRDAYGHNNSVTQTVTITDPQINIPSQPTSSTVGNPVTFTIQASGLATTTYSLADSFTGTTTVTSSNINAAGLFSWTPTTADVGSHVLTITAGDPAGNSVSTTVPLLVQAGAASTTPTTPVATTTPVSSSTPATATTTVVASTTPPVLTPPVTVTPPVVQPAPTAAASDGYVFKTPLSLGVRSVAVTELQKRLVSLGYLSVAPTGYYGVLTTAAVRKFQAANGLAQVGFVGPLTRAALNR